MFPKIFKLEIIQKCFIQHSLDDFCYTIHAIYVSYHILSTLPYSHTVWSHVWVSVKLLSSLVVVLSVQQTVIQQNHQQVANCRPCHFIALFGNPFFSDNFGNVLFNNLETPLEFHNHSSFHIILIFLSSYRFWNLDFHPASNVQNDSQCHGF